jgi:hypothetical protein
MKMPAHLSASNHVPDISSKRRNKWWMRVGAVLSLMLVLADAPAKGASSREREVSVGIEGNVERILNEPDYTPLPVNENASIILRVHSVQQTPEGQYKYNFAYLGLQSGVFNLADYLQDADGKRVRDRLPAMSVTVRALLPEDAPTTLPDMPTALPPRRIPYRPTVAALLLAWLGCGAALFYKPRPKPIAPPPPPPPPTSLGAILEPLALKAARKTITTEEKILLEQTIIGFWSEKLEISELDAQEQREAILEDEEGGALLRSVERWLYQPYSHILTSEVSKALAPYFDIPAPVKIADGDKANKMESHPEDAEEDDERGEDHEADALQDAEDESQHVDDTRKRLATAADAKNSAQKSPKPNGPARTKKQV